MNFVARCYRYKTVRYLFKLISLQINQTRAYRCAITNFPFSLLHSLDRSPVSNRIVTCSQDRNAFVWTYSEESETWKPVLVILRINRAALSVKWSPDGNKFAVATGAKSVPVCHYEESNNWWISKMIKKHKSTVLSVAWHPNSQLVATGCCDFKCRVFSSFVKDVDQPQVGFPSVSPVYTLSTTHLTYFTLLLCR